MVVYGLAASRKGRLDTMTYEVIKFPLEGTGDLRRHVMDFTLGKLQQDGMEASLSVRSLSLLCEMPRDQLGDRLKEEAQKLQDGGLLVGLCDFSGNRSRYYDSYDHLGFRKIAPKHLSSGGLIMYEALQDGGRWPVSYYLEEDLTDLFLAAGFSSFDLRGPWLAPGSSEDPALWDHLLENPPFTGFVASK